MTTQKPSRPVPPSLRADLAGAIRRELAFERPPRALEHVIADLHALREELEGRGMTEPAGLVGAAAEALRSGIEGASDGADHLGPAVTRKM